MVGKFKKGSFENKKKVVWKPKQNGIETKKGGMKTKEKSGMAIFPFHLQSLK